MSNTDNWRAKKMLRDTVTLLLPPAGARSERKVTIMVVVEGRLGDQRQGNDGYVY
jgi:hypothetical protein